MDRWNRAAHRLTHHAGSKHAFAAIALGDEELANLHDEYAERSHGSS